MGSALRVTDLHKSFKTDFYRRKKTILKGISLEIAEGEIFGYLGPNGAGKTTTLKCILGLIFPDRGAIEILGHPHLSPKAKERLGFLPENPYFYDYLTASEFLRFYSRLHRIPKSGQENKIASLLKMTGLSESAHLQLRRYSKGMLQRIGLAQSLLNDPDFMLLDEPLGGLDPLGRKEIRDVIVRLRDEGKTVLLSSHILQDIEMICDRVAIIVNGEVVNQGRLHELISHKIRFTEITCSGLDSGELQRFGECLTTHGGRTLVKILDSRNVDTVLQIIQSRKAQLHSLLPRTESLEDLFVGTVKTE